MCTIWEMAETIRAEERKAQEAHSPPKETADACSNEPGGSPRAAGPLKARLLAFAAALAHRRYGTGAKN